MYDYIIVGGGLAGLTMAEELSKETSHAILVLEKYSVWGGRVLTHRSPQYEIGAGRIHRTHTHVAALVKRFGLHTYPIPTDTMWEEGPNPFLSLFTPIREVLETLPSSTRSRHTIRELVPPSLQPILAMFPYRGEFDTLRADMALPLFRSGHTMGSDSEAGTDAVIDYYGIVEGMDAITARMAEELMKKQNVDLRLSHTVKEIVKGQGDGFEVRGTTHRIPFSFRTRNLILATNLNSLAKFPILAPLPLFQQLAMSPLIRIYAVYPTPAWFCGLTKTVTRNRLRYVIPINEKAGLIMVSYTDGEDTDYWRALEGPALEDAIQSELHALFPDKQIPRPTYLQTHDWKDGCTYWKPGEYDVEAASRAAHAPLPNLYICGESISLQQAWMEGALESAHTLLDILT